MSSTPAPIPPAPPSASRAAANPLAGPLLGASVALSLAVLGVCVPALALVNGALAEGLGYVLPAPTVAIVRAGPWTMAAIAALLAVVAFAAHRFAPRRALAPSAVLIIVLLACVAAGACVIMPLVSLGQSLSGS